MTQSTALTLLSSSTSAYRWQITILQYVSVHAWMKTYCCTLHHTHTLLCVETGLKWKCNKKKKSNPRKPLIPHALPGRPWEKIGTDLFHYNGAEILLCDDYCSKYPEIQKLSVTTSRGVTTAIKSTMAAHGIPNIVNSDNGPRFASSEFREFMEKWEFQHVTSSPGHAQSNRQAEQTVQTVKNMLKKARSSNGDPYILLEYATRLSRV